ncbi:hypothetical protein RQP46_005172 [Phenoliferia psychrophenolica]
MSGFLQKIAHNNRVSLGPKDIANLASLISKEKTAIESTNRLASDRTKASLALKEWGVSEGPDLGDILGKMSQLFEYMSSAETAFAQHDENFRLHFKSIRTKEEHLASLKRSQTSLAGKIDTQEKKVSKMKEENKVRSCDESVVVMFMEGGSMEADGIFSACVFIEQDLPGARVKLQELRQEMIGLENTVMNEDTRLGDFKRTTVREAMSIKLGGLLELAEKTVIICEIGKLVVDEIPTERTEPGAQRAQYRSFDRTEVHMGEAFRCLGEVVFNSAPLSPSQEGRNGSNEEPRSPNTYDAQDQHTLSQSQSGAYRHQSYTSQQLSAATYGSTYAGDGSYGGNGVGNEEYSGNGMGQEREDQGPSHYGGGYPQETLMPASLPTIRTSSPMGLGAMEPSSPATEYGNNNSSSSPSTFTPRNQTLLTNVHRGYDDDPANRSSLAYMDDEDEEEDPAAAFEQRQADEEAAERQRDEQAQYASSQSPTSPLAPGSSAPLPSLPFPNSPHHLNDDHPPPSPGSQYTETTDGEFRRSADVSNMNSPDALVTAPSSPSPFAATRPSATSKPAMSRGNSALALGSKHGDVYVPGSNGSAPPPQAPAGPFQGAGTSGYNSRAGGGGDASSIGSANGSAGGRINAGAFRRFAPQQQQQQQQQFALPPASAGDSRYPSQADSIRDQYYATTVPPSQQQQPQDESPRGTLVDPSGPRFDVSPLHVMKRQERNFAPQRAGSVPLYSSTGSHSGAPPPEDWRPAGSDRDHDHDSNNAGGSQVSSVGNSPALPPPPSYESPTSPSSGAGFQASNFVTRLD